MMEEKDDLNVNHVNMSSSSVVNGGVIGGGTPAIPYVKVMTDAQLQTLRKQIAAYATICEQLVQMHKNHTSQLDLSGVRLGNVYCDQLMTSSGHKITARQRWTPTPVQLQNLERIFDQGNGTPTKQKIKEITSDLSQYGQISETNVYNWFQNRRARSKRKQQNAAAPNNNNNNNNNNNAESEFETDIESPKDKKTKPEEFHSQHNHLIPRANDDINFHNSELGSDLHFFDPQSSKGDTIFSSSTDLRPPRDLSPLPFYDGLLSNSRNEHLNGKMEMPGSYSLYEHAEDFNMTG